MSNTFDKLVAKLDALSHFCPTNIVFKVTSSLIVEEILKKEQNVLIMI